MAMNSKMDQKPKPDIDASPCSRLGYSSRLGIADCSKSIPTSSSPRPMMVWPIDLRLSLWANRKNRLAAASASGRLK